MSKGELLSVDVRAGVHYFHGVYLSQAMPFVDKGELPLNRDVFGSVSHVDHVVRNSYE
ncbi:MAG: hypothetical protein BWX66_01466 [Deltaproteobacteria bacterium ADurb.Bin058]|nr:MAG: hypothetical protein BWX66_01466 [Deltaproteobacteria bacterium ADurb.Bin058]